METFSFPQALLARHGTQDIRWLGESAELLEDWRPILEDLCRRFGERPAGVRCPAAVFAQPLGKTHVIIGQAADLGGDGDQPPHALGFHFLLVPEAVYRWQGGDPFALAAAAKLNWHQRGALPPLVLELHPLRRTVEQVCTVLKREEGPTLLGAAQGLVDGSRIACVRPDDAGLVSGLWQLLPTRTRLHLWPASFAFGNQLGFDAVVVPAINKEEYDHNYLSEEQAANYPEGAYELAVQSAAEAGDQAWLDSIFARRSRRDVWRLGLWLLAAMIVLSLALGVMKLIAR
jgi:hypothetical protein